MKDEEHIKGLVKKAKEYDRESFGELYEIYFQKVYGYVFFRVRNEVDAEDLTSQAFVKILEAIRSYDERKGTFKTWILSIAHNTVIDFFRKKKRRGELDLLDPEKEEAHIVSETELIARITNEELWEMVSRLTDEQRNVVFLRFGIGMTNKEIAKVIRKSTGAVKALLFRALRTLGKRIEMDENG